MINTSLLKISMNGRIAYAIQCVEKYFIIKYPKKDITKLSKKMWEATSNFFDEWHDQFVEVIPEYLFEFGKKYNSSNWEYLSESDFNYYIKLYSDIKNDENINKLLKNMSDIATIYCYMPIPKEGKESLKLIESIEKILLENNIDLPDANTFSFTPFSEKNGWGNDFNGINYSLYLSNKK